MPNECGARIRHSDFRSGDFDDLCRSRGGWPGRQHRLPIWSGLICSCVGSWPGRLHVLPGCIDV